MRSALFSLLALACLLSNVATAQTLENPLILIWNQSVGGYVQEVSGNIIFLYAGDINNDGQGEVVAAVGGSIAAPDSAESNKVFCFSENGSLLWVRSSENEVRAAVAYDIDRDGRKEIVVAAGQTIQLILRGSVEVLESDGEKSGITRFSGIMRSVSVSDLDGDLYPEVVAASRSKLYVTDSFGSELWTYEVPQITGSPPADPEVFVRDFIGNENKEVVVGGYSLEVLNKSGKKDYPSLSVASVSGREGDRVTNVVLGKIVESGRKNVVFSTSRSDNLYAYSLKLKEKSRSEFEWHLDWAYPLVGDITSLELYDVDADGNEEILFSDENEMFYVLDGGGALEWSFKVYGRVTDVEVADVNNDNKPEILLASTSGVIYVLDASDGAYMWEYPVNEPLSRVSVAKLDLDEVPEVVVGTLQRNVFAFSVNRSHTSLFQANSFYELGQQYFMDGKYNESLKYLMKAKAIYVEQESRGDVLRVEELIRTVGEAVSKERRLLADVYYDKAVQMFIDEQYSDAKTFAEDSKRIYEDFGDTRNALKAELLLIKIDEKVRGEKTTTSVKENRTTVVVQPKPRSTAYLAVFVLVMVITLALLFKAYNRKKAASAQESKEVREYEKRLDKIVDQDLEEFEKKKV